MDFELVDRPVLILGHGISGRAMARWCACLGAEITIIDTRPASEDVTHELMAELTSLAPTKNHQLIHATLNAGIVCLRPWALICKSPGLSPSELHDVFSEATKKQIPICGELFLFVNGIRQVYGRTNKQPKILAITGTNGKTTTTSLTGHLLKCLGWQVVVAGNIGPAMLDVLSKTSSTQLPDVWVLELSSFQLDNLLVNTNHFEPHAGAILNITQDHLDWHGSMEAYADAKCQIFGRQTIQVLNRQDPTIMAKAPSSKYRMTFGTDIPKISGDWGLEVVNGMIWLVRLVEDHSSHPKTPPPFKLERIIPADALRIRGQHNAMNALAALALCTAIGAPLTPLLEGLRDYRGEPHRVQSIGVVDGVEFFDDSKGTNVGATLAAIQGLGKEKKLVLILGGEGKGQDFSPLIPAIKTYVKAVVLIGKDTPLLRNTLTITGVPLLDAESMSCAVAQAARQADSGDAILLSPACASLDMFTNYVHRAEVFCQSVREWGTERGFFGEIG